MNCSRIHELLPDYLGKEIDAGDRAAIETHLAACPSCRQTVEELRATLAEMTSLTTIDLESASRQVQDLPEVPVAMPRGWGILPRLVGVAAVFAIGMLTGRLSLPDAVPRQAAPADQPVVVTDAGPIHPAWLERVQRSRGLASGGLATPLALIANSSRP